MAKKILELLKERYPGTPERDLLERALLAIRDIKEHESCVNA